MFNGPKFRVTSRSRSRFVRMRRWASKKTAIPNGWKTAILLILCKARKSLRGVLHQAAVLALLCACLTAFASSALAQAGTFVATGSMTTARSGHTATLLNNGQVLVAGGFDDVLEDNILVSAELYSSATGTFNVTGSMTTARKSQTATLLNNGEVLITGGVGLAGALASAELYNPTTGTFTPTGSMTMARNGDNLTFFTATLLNNGQVLIAGGSMSPSTELASAELYNPATGTFTPTGGMTTARKSQTATLLNNGEVLITGGVGLAGAALASAELYNPTTGTFTSTGSMTTARVGQTATLLKTGKVLVAGGDINPPSSVTAELYDPLAGTFAALGSTGLSIETATLLNNGQVLFVGGSVDILAIIPGVANAGLYDPTAGTFTATSSISDPTSGHTATLLNNGQALVAGGIDFSPTVLAGADLYVPVVLFPTYLGFSNQPAGTTSAAQTVTLTNNGPTALSIAISGTNASYFAETDNCTGSVSSGGSCSISVTFMPATAVSQTVNLTIASNLYAGSPLVVPLTGIGVTPIVIVSLSANNLTFINQMIGTSSSPQSLTLSNAGNVALIISKLVIGGTNATDFAEGDNCGGSVTASGSCRINVTFSPTATGTRTGMLIITDNATSPQSPQTVALTGTGVAPTVSVSPSSITFTNQYVGTSGLPQTVTVTNNGSAALNITSVTASPADFGPLSSCGNSLAAGSSCAVGVFFDPTVGGTRTGTLTITDNASSSPQTVALSGVGQDFSVTPTSSQAATATVTPGQTASYSLTITPNGGFTQSVTFTCTGAPSQSTCAVSPNSVALNGSTPATFTVTVTTAAASLLVHENPRRGPLAKITYRKVLLILALLGLILLSRSPRGQRLRRLRLAYGLALLLFLCAGVTMSGCGGGGSSSTGSSGNPGTPAGTYTLVATGTFTSGSTTLTRNSNLTLVVQ